MGVLLGACSQASPPENPATFARPGPIDFGCFLVTPERIDVQPLADCQGDPTEREGGMDPVLYAFVLQTETGEVAAIDLSTNDALDTRDEIPGYTFTDVGDLPVAIVLRPDAGQFTYVANGTGTVGAFDTRAFFPPAGGRRARRARLGDVALPGLARPSDMVLVSGREEEDALLVSSEETGEVYRIGICGPDVADCPEGTLQEPEILSLPPVDLEAAVVTRGPTDEPYSMMCPAAGEGPPGDGAFELPPPLTWPDSPEDMSEDMPEDMSEDMPEDMADAGTEDDAPASVTPRPAALALDANCGLGADGCLLVADRALPVIHRFAIDGAVLSPQEPLFTGAPVRDVVVSPQVPVTVTASAEEMTHYVYAIDDRDGSVLVMQDGAILPVNPDPKGRVDRLNLGLVATGTRALTLEVLTPGSINPQNPVCELVDREFWGEPSRLRGVFLAAGLSDGTVAVFDIHDYDLLAEAEGSGAATDAPQGTGGTCRRCPFVVTRNRMRIGTELGATEWETPVVPTVASTPVYAFDDRQVSLQRDGEARDGRLPSLSCVTCPQGMHGIFPDALDSSSPTVTTAEPGTFEGSCEEGEALICSAAAPHLPLENWLFEYEGSLPNVRGVGYLVDAEEAGGQARFDIAGGGEQDLCVLGVLGRDVLPQGGDLLELVSPPDEPVQAEWTEQERELCMPMVERLEAGDRAVAFEIIEAKRDYLILGDGDVRNNLDGIPTVTGRSGLPRTYSDVRNCYKESQAVFQVRVNNSFLVLGAVSGFEHATLADDSGACVRAPEVPGQTEGRVWIGEAGAPLESYVFNNGKVSLAFEQGPQGRERPEGLNLSMSVRVEPVMNGLRFDYSATSAPALLETLKFNALDNRLYVVDPYRGSMYARDLVQNETFGIN